MSLRLLPFVGLSFATATARSPQRSSQAVSAPLPQDGSFYKGLRIQGHPEVHERVSEIVARMTPTGSAVLDLAAGEGALAQRLIDIGRNLCCTSWNGRVNAGPARVFHQDLDERFGVQQVGGTPYVCVLAVEIIEHLRNPFQFLRCVRNALRDDGIFILTTPNIESGLSRLQVLLRGSPLSFSEEETVKNRHIFMPNRIVLELFFQQVGLKIIERHFWPEERVRFSGPRSVAKSMLLALVKAIGAGDTKGATRIYVLKRTDPAPENRLDRY